MSKIFSIFLELNSLVRGEDSKNPNELQNIFEEVGNIDISEYLNKNPCEKIDILVFLFFRIVNGFDASQVRKLDFLFELAFELKFEVSVEEFKGIYDDISINGIENQIKEKHLRRLNMEYNQRIKLFVIEDGNENARELKLPGQTTFKYLLKNPPNIDTDLKIKFSSDSISIYQDKCQGDVDFFYFSTEEIVLENLVYFSSKGEKFVVVSIDKKGILFNTLENRRQFQYTNGVCTSTSKKEIDLADFGFSFQIIKDKWHAVKSSNNQNLYKAFHTKGTFTKESEEIKLAKDDKKIIMVHDRIYTLYYSLLI